jgi:hypothetical protein
MPHTVGNFSVIDPPKDAKGVRAYKMIRFAVTYVEDGEPMWTSEGWRITADRIVWPPTPMAGTNIGQRRGTTFNQLSEKFATRLRDAVLAFPGVVEELGPQIVIPARTPRDKAKNRALEGEPVVMEGEG